MSYAIIESTSFLTSSQRAEAISRELYCITSPRFIQESYQHDGRVCGIVHHNDKIRFAIEVQEDFSINVHPDAEWNALFLLFPEYTDYEKGNLNSSRNEILLPEFIPSSIKLNTLQEMIDLGWNL